MRKQKFGLMTWNDMGGHVKKCSERYCELANEKNEQLNKVSTPCLDDHHFKKRKNWKWPELVFGM